MKPHFQKLTRASTTREEVGQTPTGAFIDGESPESGRDSGAFSCLLTTASHSPPGSRGPPITEVRRWDQVSLVHKCPHTWFASQPLLQAEMSRQGCVCEEGLSKLPSGDSQPGPGPPCGDTAGVPSSQPHSAASERSHLPTCPVCPVGESEQSPAGPSARI